MLLPALALAQAPRVVQIEATTDGRTHPEVIVAYSRVGVGDTFGPEDEVRARRYLDATGLFKDVKLTAVPAGPGEIRLLIEVTEKLSWIVAPIFTSSSSNTGGGLIYAENNVLGLSKKFVVGAQTTTNESGVYVGFLDPNVFNNPQFRLSFEGQLKSDRMQEYGDGPGDPDPQVLRSTRINTFGVVTEFTINWRDTFRTAVKYRFTRVHPLAPQEGYPVTAPAEVAHETTSDASMRLMAGIDTRQNLGPILEGLNLEASTEFSLAELGSAYDYQKYGLLYRQGFRVRESQNLTLRVEGQYARDLPFHTELLSGGGNLRGFLHRQFRGDTRASVTAEYHFPLFDIRALQVRGVGFSDTAITYFRDLPASGQLLDQDGQLARGYLPGQAQGRSGAEVAQGVGVGLRLYLATVVLPLLGVDVAYGVNPGEVRVYLSIGVSP
nr:MULTISPECIES: BamA/TamA family outer membrane protein [Myxococcaceae]